MKEWEMLARRAGVLVAGESADLSYGQQIASVGESQDLFQIVTVGGVFSAHTLTPSSTSRRRSALRRFRMESALPVSCLYWAISSSTSSGVA